MSHVEEDIAAMEIEIAELEQKVLELQNSNRLLGEWKYAKYMKLFYLVFLLKPFINHKMNVFIAHKPGLPFDIDILATGF